MFGKKKKEELVLDPNTFQETATAAAVGFVNPRTHQIESWEIAQGSWDGGEQLINDMRNRVEQARQLRARNAEAGLTRSARTEQEAVLIKSGVYSALNRLRNADIVLTGDEEFLTATGLTSFNANLHRDNYGRIIEEVTATAGGFFGFERLQEVVGVLSSGETNARRLLGRSSSTGRIIMEGQVDFIGRFKDPQKNRLLRNALGIPSRPTR